MLVYVIERGLEEYAIEAGRGKKKEEKYGGKRE